MIGTASPSKKEATPTSPPPPESNNNNSKQETSSIQQTNNNNSDPSSNNNNLASGPKTSGPDTRARNGAAKSTIQQQQDTSQHTQSSFVVSADYLSQLIKDKKQLEAFPSIFIHLPRLLEEEITRVRQALFQLTDCLTGALNRGRTHSSGGQHESRGPLELPEPEGELIELAEKIYVPRDAHPDYNFVGRILGPRGMTAKQLEQQTGCKLKIRGRGSMRDKKREEQNCGKANWEHLSDDLHVLITVEDTQNRAQIKMARALEEVKQLLVPIVDGEDELKKRQLIELAIINGTYRNVQLANSTGGAVTHHQHHQYLQHQHQHQPHHHHHQHHQFLHPHQAGAGGNGLPMNVANGTTNSSISGNSPVPTTGSTTPNSSLNQHLSGHHSQLNAIALAAAAAAAANQHQHQHQQHHSSHHHHHHQHHAHQLAASHHHHPHGPLSVVHPLSHHPAQHHAHQHHHLLPPPPPHHHQAEPAGAQILQATSPAHQQSSAGPHAATAAAVALMAVQQQQQQNQQQDPTVAASAILYAQQYHDFHHYAALAAQQQQQHQQQQQQQIQQQHPINVLNNQYQMPAPAQIGHLQRPDSSSTQYEQDTQSVHMDADGGQDTAPSACVSSDQTSSSTASVVARNSTDNQNQEPGLHHKHQQQATTSNEANSPSSSSLSRSSPRAMLS